MAARPAGFGLSAEVKAKMDSKFDPDTAREGMNFIRMHTELEAFEDGDSELIQQKLKDGVVLCKLMMALEPGSIKKFNTSKMAFKQMENIGFYLDASFKYGVAKTDQFQTVDLFEGQNMKAVIDQLHALGRKAKLKGKQGIGPKEAEGNVRSFTKEQLESGKNVIGLQMGSNKGASQAGQNFGKTRAIID